MKMTDWHRLFGITLTDYFADTAYTVELEKDLSLKKQFLDVVVIERKEGKLPDTLPDGLENIAVHNLISFKSFRESFDDWAADELTGHYVNYRKQVRTSKKLLPKDDFRLYAVCTRFPQKLAKEASLIPVKPGVFDLRWGIRDIRVIVTGKILKEQKNAVWLMFSAIENNVQYGVAYYKGKLDEMSTAINDLLGKYKTEGIIAMSYTMEDYRREIKQRALEIMTPEERLKGLPAEERLRGLPAEERLRGLSPDEIEHYLKKIRKRGLKLNK